MSPASTHCGIAHREWRLTSLEVIRRLGQLDSSEDPEHERREGAVQRAAWVVMALFLVAALAGLFGSGPLARAQASARGFDVEYPRFARRDAPTEVRVSLAQGVPAQVWLARDVLGSWEIEEVTPTPESVTPEADRLVYRHAAVGPSEVV